MLKTRLIMTLLIENNQLVKGLKFDKSRRIDTIIPTLKVYEKREVDELVIYDTKASERGHINFELISDVARNVSIPLSYGGGISALEDIRKILRSGADKVVVNSSVYSNPALIKSAAEEFGRQCIIIGIDVKKTEFGYKCYSESGKTEQDFDFLYWFSRALELDPGEIIVTSIDRDGMMNGFDMELYSLLPDNTYTPTIASGGAGKPSDFIDVLQFSSITAVAASSIFHFTEQTPKSIKKALLNEGILTRI